MSGSEIAALIVAITSALVAILAGIRNLHGDKIKSDVAAAAAVLAGYTNFAATLQARLDSVQTEHRADRQGWLEERATMRREHAEEIAKIRAEHREQMRECDERIDELGAKVYALQNRPPETRDREGDPR